MIDEPCARDQANPEVAGSGSVAGPQGATRGAPALFALLRERLGGGRGPLFVGIDGRSGAGKSTLAATIATGLAPTGGATVIDGDGFYAGGSAATWDRRTIVERADRVIDWRRQRDVLSRLRRRGVAEWHPFDWDAEDWDGDVVPLAPDPVVARVAPVVVLEGAYSCRPELHDVLDLLVLLDVPRDVRRKQLLDREGADYRADWEARWSAAEDHYFAAVMPPDRFDLVLDSS